ncbi:hypothetical protein INR49_030214 [Caranx melampygus]|nr:hypothetical protein INR49_030214 [Caranx melampygus]
MENYTYTTYTSFTLQLEGLTVSKGSVYPVFLFLFFSYLFIIVANIGIAALVFMDKNLHQPMYLLFWNLSFNDVLGNSIMVPRLLVDMLRPPSERLISYYECVVQAFTIHMYGTTAHTVLMIMAFDRYVAICNPLRYSAIMTNRIRMENYTYNSLTLQLEGLNVSKDSVYPAFTSHMFGTTTNTVLMIMAFDRYVAICNPLRYSAIMSKKMVIKLTVSAWGVAFVLVGILLGLTIRLSRCRTMIMNPYCDNASLFKLSCESVFINNVYGLTFTVVLFTGSIGSMVLTYTKITVVCLTSKNKSLNSKALKTCSTHLLVYLIMVFSGMSLIALHRFPEYTEYRKLCSILFHIFPGSLNPIIYGVQSKEIRKFLAKLIEPKKMFPL